MTIGTVKSFHPDLGYGYISPDDGTPDVFVHFTALDRSGLQNLGQGDRVQYSPTSEGGIVRATSLSIDKSL